MRLTMLQRISGSDALNSFEQLDCIVVFADSRWGPLVSRTNVEGASCNGMKIARTVRWPRSRDTSNAPVQQLSKCY